MKDELLPCPFCGDEGTIEHLEVYFVHGDYGTEYWAKCINSSCQVNFRGSWSNPYDAIKQWNKRIMPDNQEALEALDILQGRIRNWSTKHGDLTIVHDGKAECKIIRKALGGDYEGIK